MQKLTKRQQEVLNTIIEHQKNTGYPPTRAEIARAMGFRSANAAEEHVKALAKKGAIEMMPGASRGIRVVGVDDRGAESANESLPIVGRVAAGQPIMAVESIDAYCEIPPDFFSPKADYLLRVQGESMVNAGILDGDLLAVHRSNTVNNGQISVVRVDDEVTVKRWKQEGHMVYLIAENPDFAPIEVDLRERELQVEGLGVGVIRR